MRNRVFVPLLLLFGGCTEIQVGEPDSLWLLWLIPATMAFLVYVYRTKARLLQRFVSPEILSRLTQGMSRQRQHFKSTLILLGLVALVLALAEVRYGFTWETVKREGVDIVVALDVSDSMLVEDAEAGGKLSRLERAKREIADLLDLLEGDRIGLVAFAGTAFVECPLTLDYGAAEIFLDAIDTELIPVKGTDLAQAIDASLTAFDGGTNSSQAVILITDGEDHSGRALAAAEKAKLAGVRIFTIGIGRDEGAPIPDQDGGFRRDRRGEIVLSRLDEPTLQKVALETGGRYVRSVTGDVDLEQIYSQGIKAVLADQELSSKRRQRWEERFQWFVALALMALMLEPLISVRQRRKRQRKPSATMVLVTAGVLTAPALWAQPQSSPAPSPGSPETVSPRRVKDPYEAYAQELYDQAMAGFTDLQVEYPEDPEVALNLGSTHYQMGNFPEAERAFARAALASDEALRHEALYNLGNSAYRQGRLQEAADLFKAALELDPEDEDAKFNLEFVRDEIRRRHEEAQQRQNQQDPDQQGEEDQQQQEQDGGDEKQQDQGKEGQQDPTEQPSQSGQDSDQDGLPDQTEESGANPTDPQNPDTDGDGLPDGAEDLNRSGGQDEGETDPNNPDSDGDGVPDGQEAGAAGAGGQGQPQELAGLTPEEAERYLQALEEGRPTRQLPPGVQASRSEKDW